MKWALRVALIVYWLTIFVLTHIPQQRMPSVPIGDKIEHLLAYGLLGGLLYFNLRKSGLRTNIEALTLLICMVYGAIDEWAQAIPGINRSCELLDWFADCAGACIAVVVCWGVLELTKSKASGTASGAGFEVKGISNE